MSSVVFNSFLNDIFQGNIDLSLDEFYCMLVTSGYIPDKDLDAKRSDITNEVSAAGYSSGGILANVTMNNNLSNDRFEIFLGSVSWSSSSIISNGAVYYKRRGGGANLDELIAYIDFNGDVQSISGTFSLSSSQIRIQN